MGGSSSQTVGYKYFAGLQVVIGNCIEYMININPDNRGWIFTKLEDVEQLKDGDTSIVVNKPNLFGGDKQEGGWVGTIDIHTGLPEHLRQNEYLAAQDSELVSSFPYLSHVVFRGPTLDKGFQLVSMSGMLKEVLYWPKRTRIKDDGSEQWYKIRPSDNSIVCEIDADQFNPIVLSPNGTFDYSVDFNFRDGFYVARTVDETNVSYLKNQKYTLNVARVYSGAIEDPINGSVSINTNQIGKVKISLIVRSSYNPSGLEVDYTVGGDLENYEKVVLKDSLGEETGYILINLEYKSTGLHTTTINVTAIPIFQGGLYVNDLAFLNTDLNYGYVSFSESRNTSEIKAFDINPIHKIREIITDDTAMNKPEAMINDANFIAAADRIWDEGLGVSGSFTEKSCKEAIDELLYHIEAGIRVNRQTGLYEIILFRDDLLDLDNAQIFDKGNIKTFGIETANIDDVINSVNVNYYDRYNIKDSSFSLDELGSILSNQSNAETLDFPYFMNRRNAELVGNWKLKQLSTPTRKGTFTTGKYDARKINRYDVVKLTWQNQNMIEVPIRIMKIGLGDGRDNTVTLDWVEVIPYSSIVFPNINVDPPTSNVLPPQPNQSIAFEMPYLEAVQRFGQSQVDTELANNPDLGYLMVATKKPQNNSINALLFTDSGTGYQQTSIVDYCPVVQLDQDISYLDTSFAVKNVSAISQAEAGTLILCDEELMVYQSFDDVTNIITVKRAALDTVPKPHLQDAVFYFYDAFSAFDSEQYVLSEVIDAKVLTTTPSGVQELNDVTALSVEMNARPIRPYPPANVKINGDYYPVEIETDLIVTWVDRNRLQQTGGTVLGWTDEGVALESGASTMLTIKEHDAADLVIATHNINATGTNSYTLTIAAMQAETRAVEVTAKTVREGYESYQFFQHKVQLSTFFSEPYNITATVTII